MGITTPNKMQDEVMMRLAIGQAHLAQQAGEVPVGAIVSCEGQVIGQGHNQVITLNNPTAHAEVMALQSAGENRNNYRLPECTLYVTLEPCMMCAGALVHSRVQRVVFGAYDEKTGVIETVDDCFSKTYLNHKIEWQGGVLKDECSALISAFFKLRRKAKKSTRFESREQ
ncbi:tRNA adenosine(34) deaminase TadA [Marinicella rhabdoformis]|uniref:tRNA adenosine(34) deaminase TadA n=1 Tax=Marinicella rhabdoformis TaxID=2580566 RepID=UPI001FEBCFD4|nr:tRNA adenosine(34) deaminase TadA [Marinicella rhabdoformis]